MNNWEAGRLLLQCIVFLIVDVSPLGYGRLYNIIFVNNRYDVTMDNFLRYSCVYFVKMLVGSLGARGVYV
jgi:hypothetical protein